MITLFVWRSLTHLCSEARPMKGIACRKEVVLRHTAA